MYKQRKRGDIIAAMLSVARVHGKKTYIMHGANLSYKLLSRYLDDVVKLGLLEFSVDSNVFELTDKGEKYLKHYNEYVDLRDTLGTLLRKRKARLARILGSRENSMQFRT